MIRRSIDDKKVDSGSGSRRWRIFDRNEDEAPVGDRTLTRGVCALDELTRGKVVSRAKARELRRIATHEQQW